MTNQLHGDLHQLHTPQAISTRLEAATNHSYVGDFVLGAVDGAVTTFAIIAGVAGAGLSSGVAVVLGVANLLADGFSMAASNYLKARADREVVQRFREIEEAHIDKIPEGEKEEIRQIFAAKGFDGTILDQIVDVITKDRKQWVDTMLTEEWGLQLETPIPKIAGLVTFAAFVLAGSVPLLPLFLPGTWTLSQIFVISSLATAMTFFLVGMFRGRVVNRPLLLSGLETLFVGSLAATLSYLVGMWLKGWASL